MLRWRRSYRLRCAPHLSWPDKSLQGIARQITIKRIERNKRKHVTAIHGLEAFNIDLKKAAKQFASKFATGASVTKNPQGQDEIVIQGDVSDEVLEMIEEEVGILKGIPADNVEIVEDKKKKPAD